MLIVVPLSQCAQIQLREPLLQRSRASPDSRSTNSHACTVHVRRCPSPVSERLSAVRTWCCGKQHLLGDRLIMLLTWQQKLEACYDCQRGSCKCLEVTVEEFRLGCCCSI